MVLNYPIVVAKIRVTGTNAELLWSQEIPKGLVGGRVLIEYADECWNNLKKAVIFRGAVTRDVLDNDSEVIIPAEVLSRSGVNLYIGVYGTDTENNIGLPTFWVKLGVIRDAADPQLDTNANPDLPVWARLLERTPDWQAPAESDNHILNRTHWKEWQSAHNIYDGTLEGRIFHMIEDGIAFVKISDRVLTAEDLIGSTVVLQYAGDPPGEEIIEITEDMIYDLQVEMGFPVIAADELVMCVQSDFSLYGMSIDRGVYFLRAEEDGILLGYTKSISALPDYEEIFHKLDDKYINAEWLAGRTEGNEAILLESVQPFNTGYPSYAKQDFLFKIEANQQYTVHWDGEEYPCQARTICANMVVGYFLGNAHLLDSDYLDTGEPFCVVHITIMGIPLITEIAARDEATEHTIAIYAAGKIQNRLPFKYLPSDFIFPKDFYYSGVDNDHLAQAYYHLLNGGAVYANYSSNRFKVLMIDLDIWDSRFSNLVMTDGKVIMMWSQETGWLRQAPDSFMLTSSGKKYRIGINGSGQLYTTDVTNQTIYP